MNARNLYIHLYSPKMVASIEKKNIHINKIYNTQKRKQKYRDRVNKGLPLAEVRQIINMIDLQFTK